MENRDELILKAATLEKLPEALKGDLPNWCLDESSFQQYKQLLRISKEINLELPLIDEEVKTSLDQLFQEKRKPNWFWLNIIAVSGSTNNSQKAMWMSLAAVMIIVVVSTVFIWQNTSQQEKKEFSLKAKVERSKTLQTSKKTAKKIIQPTSVSSPVVAPVLIAAVEDAALPMNRTMSENTSVAEFPESFSIAGSVSSDFEVVPTIEKELSEQNNYLSLEDTLFQDVLELLEPTF